MRSWKKQNLGGRRPVVLMAAAALLAGVLFTAGGCGTGPSEEEIRQTVQALVEAAEFSGELHRWMQTELTDYERQVFRLFLAGYPYSEIASLLSSHSKAVDNALQRVRRKLRKFYSTHSVSA